MRIPNARTVIVTVAASVLAAAAYAKDLGTWAQVWQITEVDMRQLLVASASRVDWDRVEDDTAKSAKIYLDRLPIGPGNLGPGLADHRSGYAPAAGRIGLPSGLGPGGG